MKNTISSSMVNMTASVSNLRVKSSASKQPWKAFCLKNFYGKEVRPVDLVNLVSKDEAKRILEAKLLTPEEEKTLISLALSNDKKVQDKAKTELTIRLGKFLVKVALYAQNYTNVPVEDLYAASREGMLKAIPKYDASKNATFMTFLRMQLTNHLQAVIAEEYKNSQHFLDYKKNHEPSYDINDSFLSNMSRYELKCALKSLSDKERFIIEKYFLEENTYQDIAKELGCSIPNIYYKVSGALTKLRRYYKLCA